MISEIDEACVHLEEFDALLDVMVELERIWFLCEIFLLNPISSKLLAIDFAKWIYETERGDVDVLLEFFGTLDAAETYRGNNRRLVNTPEEGYWETIYMLSVQGSLDEVWKLLCLHSHFPRVDLVELTGNERRHMSCALELKSILSSHPIFPMYEATVAYLLETWLWCTVAGAANWRYGRSGLKAFSIGIIFARTHPRNCGALEILIGNMESICGASKSNWLRFGLGKLLYVFPPPLSRSNIAKIADESIATCNSRGGDIQRSKQQHTVKNIIGGEIGVAIRHMHESKLCNCRDARVVPFIDLAFTLPTAFLCYNLINGGGMVDLKEPLVKEDIHSSYFEQLLVSVVDDLISHRFPVEIVVGMINTCPTLGPDLSKKSLPLVVVDTDELARELSLALRAQASLFNGQSVVPELISRARDIEVARGLYWFDRTRLREPSASLMQQVMSRAARP